MRKLVLKDAALGLLARREHSRVELQRKLQQRGYDEAETAKLLDKLQSESLLSDQRYCEALLRYRINRGQGPIKIQNELRQQGVVDDLIGAAFAEYEDGFWRQQCQRVWQRKFNAKLPKDAREIMRQQRFLQQRGFFPADIRQCLQGGTIDEFE